jgi:F-type H+-transporting ATPase subunit delta
MSRTDVGLHIADVYAKALYELSEQSKIVEEVKSELEMLEAIIAQEHGFLNIMSSPQFSGDYKQSLLHKMFAGKVNELTLNFLLVADEHNRMMFLPQIIARFNEIWEAHHGFSVVELTLTEDLNEGELENASEAIANAMQKKVILKLNVKPSIVGGAVIKYGDSLIDNSIKGRLHRAVRTVMDKCKELGIKHEVRYQ